MREAPRVAILVGDGAFEFPIVGESHYQAAIEAITGGKTERGAHHKCTAVLIPEPTNPYDLHAVRIDIEGQTVGYLSRDVATFFLDSLSKSGFAAAVASAIIVGGWDRGDGDVGSFGVKLNAALPFVLSTAISSAEPTLKVLPSAETSAAVSTLATETLSHLPKKKRRKWPAVMAVLIVTIFVFEIFGANSKADKVAGVLNTQFGRICEAKIEGLFSDTLTIDWTASTTKLDSIAVMAAIGGAKSNIYDSGVRYFKFPNNSGGYNIIDWKTGEKTSVSERARFYFP
jgi:hypothetical protein